jgi:hypothetical protein
MVFTSLFIQFRPRQLIHGKFFLSTISMYLWHKGGGEWPVRASGHRGHSGDESDDAAVASHTTSPCLYAALLACLLYVRTVHVGCRRRPKTRGGALTKLTLNH